MDTQTQIERLIELAIVQRTELKQLVEQLPQLREHLNAEIERNLEEIEPQLRSELEEFCDKRAVDANAKVGSALEAKMIELSKSLEVTTQARFNAIKEQERKVEELRQLAAKEIEGHVATLPDAVKEIVGAELARFPRAGEIDQLRKEFAEPRGLNPRGKWTSQETYNRLDLVTWNGDSYVSNIDGNTEKPSRNSPVWTLSAARGIGGGGPADLSALTAVPSNGSLLIGSGTSWVNGNIVAGAGINVVNGAGSITISATDGDITLDDGTAESPSLHFTNDADTGIYRPAANTLGISVSGTQIAYFDQNGLTVPNAGVVAGGSFHGANGNANNPSLSFSGDQDTGFYRHASNQIGVSTSGTASLIFTNNAGELLGHTGVSVTFGAGSSGATLALGQGTNGGVTITPKGSGTAVIAGTTIPTSKTLVVTTDKLSALAATTSSELAGVISDETGTGALVFANTPTLVTPNIGAATGTSFNLTGSGTLGTTLVVNSTTDSTSKDTGAIITEGGLGVEKSATIGGKLAVGGAAISVPLSIKADASRNAVQIINGGPATESGTVLWYGSDASTIRGALAIDAGGFHVYNSSVVEKFGVTDAGNATLAGNLNVSGTGTSSFGGTVQHNASTATGYNLLISSSGITTGRGAWSIQNTGGYLIAGIESSAGGTTLSNSTAYASYIGSFANVPLHFVTNSLISATLTSNGNLLVGTTTDSYGKLQVSGGTNSAGTIRSTVQTAPSSGAGTELFYDTTGATGYLIAYDRSGSVYKPLNINSSNTVLGTNGSTALTLDSSQNAKFEGIIYPKASTGSAIFALDTAGQTFSLADSATANPFSNANNFSGMFIINDTSSTGHVAMILTGAGALGIVYQTGTNFTVTQGTSGKTNIYLSGNAVVIENKSGGSINYNVMAFRTRQSE